MQGVLRVRPGAEVRRGQLITTLGIVATVLGGLGLVAILALSVALAHR